MSLRCLEAASSTKDQVSRLYEGRYEIVWDVCIRGTIPDDQEPRPDEGSSEHNCQMCCESVKSIYFSSSLDAKRLCAAFASILSII